MVRIALAMVVVMAGGGLAAADDDAYQCRAASKDVKPVTDPVGRCIGFSTGADKVTGLSGSGTLYATADARTVVFVQDFPMASEFGPKQEAVAAWRDGVQIASYTMQDVVGRMELVSHSTSHVMWVDSVAVIKNELELKTTSLKDSTLNLVDGKLAVKDGAYWNLCDAIVYGEVRGGHIARPAVLKGKVDGPVSFTGATKDRTATVCLKGKPGAWKVETQWDTLYNALPREPKRCAAAFLLAAQKSEDVTGTVSKLSVSGRESSVTIGKLTFVLASDLPVPFKQGDTIGVHYSCGGPPPGTYCDARIEDKAGKALVIAAMNNTDTLSDGWTSKPGKVLKSEQAPSEKRRSLKRTQEVTVSKGTSSVSVAPATCEEVTEGGVTYLVSGGAESWEGVRPPDSIDSKWYSLWRLP